MADSPGWRRLKAHPDFKNMVKRTLDEQQKAVDAVSRQSALLQPKGRSPQKGYPKPKRKN